MTPFKFDLTLNYKLQFLMMQHSDGKPTLIFCSTRKSVEMTAKHLIQTLQIQLNPAQTQKLYDVANTITDVKARETIKHGVGYHHAGMSPETRHAIEGVFRRIIIKSTKCYDNCGFRDYTEIAIHQMMGRAGRPQFDTSATVLILTTNEDKVSFC
ncbi:hypothetical protein JTB14_012039 [Gonioctena quinquepunctata]|nr:hypothetical protein JTB14_012039 [Gonioctena quinquepunctata]